MRIACEIKICGITRRCDAELAQRLGADFVGFVLAPRSKRFVPPERLAELTANLRVRRVGVFVNASRDEILRAAEYLDIIQLHGNETPEFAASLPLPVWKAFTPVTADIPDFPAERFVLDSPGGGTGTSCDWRFAAEIAQHRPVMLAGGIGRDNARRACEIVKPLGLDLSGSLESAPGIKSETKMIEFFKEMKR